MAEFQRVGVGERDIEQAITALKKGAYLLKYGRRGKPKFCPFRLSTDESMLIWYYGKEEKQLELRHVTRIIPGQRTSIFQRYPRPEKEYQSFSLIYNDRSLDLICKDKDEAEVWFVGLKALIARGSYQKVRSDGRADSVSSDSPRSRRVVPSVISFDQGDNQRAESIPPSRLGKAFADIVSYTATTQSLTQAESFTHSVSSLSSGVGDNPNGRSSTTDTVRISLSSAVSSSSQGSCHEDFDSLGDIFIWGEGTGDGLLGGGVIRVRTSSSTKVDALLPRALESTAVLDALGLACGSRHAALVTKQGEVFTWGEESGGRLGHGVEADVSHPKLVDTLTGLNIETIACGEYHTCAVTLSGDLYTWGDGTHNCGLLGHGSEASHWIPKKVNGLLDSIQVSYVSCGPWHTAMITSAGQLFTFGDGSFGVLGHGDQSRSSDPREVDAFKGLRTLRVACGVWHTAAVVEIMTKPSDSRLSSGSFSGHLFTWGNGDKGRLGHGDKENRLAPECVAAVVDLNFCQVACGDNLTVALTTAGRVYTMGSTAYGQLGSPSAAGNIPTCVASNIADSFVEEIACGSDHVAIMTSKSDVYTWGKGAHGQLGHGDNENRHTPTRVDFLKDKQVKGVVCGSNLTAVICVHKGISSADNSMCSGCQNLFSFRRKRHNCYNCGLVFCKACSSRKSLKASLAPTTNKPYRVCDDCFTKLQKAMESSGARAPKGRSGNVLFKPNELAEKENGGLQGQYPRLSSVDSFNLSEGRSSHHGSKVDLNDRRVFPFANENLKKGISPLSKVPTTYGTSGNFLSISVPSSRMPSRTTSPVSGKPSSPLSATSMFSPTIRAAEKVFDDMKLKNESLSQEVTYLRAQVEDLATKYRRLEDELDRKSRQLKEATAVAADESEKCEAAKEVILSLSEQLKEMADKLADGPIPSNRIGANAEQVVNDPKGHSSASSVSNYQASSKGWSNVSSSNSSFPNGTKAQTEKSEWVVQDEPGVYVTLSSLPGGGNELKRVRFSRKRFTEQQAENWWSEHGSSVCEKHKVRNTE